MFLVCSGGGLGYRYWLQGRYRAAESAIPSRTSNSRTQNSLRGPTCHAQQARISYNSARNTVLLHRMLKGIFSTFIKDSKTIFLNIYNINTILLLNYYHYSHINIILIIMHSPLTYIQSLKYRKMYKW